MFDFLQTNVLRVRKLDLAVVFDKKDISEFSSVYFRKLAVLSALSGIFDVFRYLRYFVQ